MPKYTNAWGAEIRAVFLSNTNIMDATMDAFVGLKYKSILMLWYSIYYI